MAVVTFPSFDYVHEIKEAAICNMALSRLGGELIRDTAEETKQARLCRSSYAISRDQLLMAFEFGFATKSAYVPEDDQYQFPYSDYEHVYIADADTEFTGSCDTDVEITGISGITVDESLIGMELYGDDIRPGTRIIAVDATEGAETITIDRATTDDVTDFGIRIPMLKILEANSDPDSLFEVVGSNIDKRILSNDVSAIDEDSGGNLLEIRYTYAEINPDNFSQPFKDALALLIAVKIALAIGGSIQMRNAIAAEFSSMLASAKVSASEERNINAADYWWSDRQGFGASPYRARS